MYKISTRTHYYTSGVQLAPHIAVCVAVLFAFSFYNSNTINRVRDSHPCDLFVQFLYLKKFNQQTKKHKNKTKIKTIDKSNTIIFFYFKIKSALG